MNNFFQASFLEEWSARVFIYISLDSNYSSISYLFNSHLMAESGIITKQVNLQSVITLDTAVWINCNH